MSDVLSLHVVIGPPGSGKTTYIKNKKFHKNTVIVSSDDIRYQKQADQFGDPYAYRPELNGEVFDEFHGKIEEYLRNGRSVVADATNMTIRDRSPFFEVASRVEKETPYKVAVCAYVLLAPVGELVENDSKRSLERVGEDVIIHSLTRFQTPNPKVEPWYSITLYNKDDDRTIHNNWKTAERHMKKFNQKNPHHKYTLYEHSRRVANILSNGNRDTVLYDIGMQHDIGKLYTQKVTDGVATYYGHAGVSSYLSLYYNYASPSAIMVAKVIERHMTDPEKWREDRAMKEMKPSWYRIYKRLWDIDKSKNGEDV